MDTLSLHLQLGVPIMYQDQLNIIATHLSDMKHDDNRSTLDHQTYLNNCLPSIKILHSKKARKLTRWILKSQNYWYTWQHSEYKQHQQYHDQHIFRKPQHIPSGASRLPFIWTYLIKNDENKTKKASTTYNGAPHMNSTVTMDHTYAGSLNHTVSRIFWSILAVKVT